MLISQSAPVDHSKRNDCQQVEYPIETEIYILPNGQIVIADLPIELADKLTNLGEIEPCMIGDMPNSV